MVLPSLAPQLLAMGLNVAVKATVLLGLACLLLNRCQRSSAAFRHTLWFVTLLGLLFLPFAIWAVPVLRLPVIPDEWVGVTRTLPNLLPTQTAESTQVADTASTPVRTTSIVITNRRSDALRMESSTPLPDSSLWSNWPLLPCVLWMLGVIAFGVQMVRGLWQTVRLQQQSVVLHDPALNDAIRELSQRVSLRRRVILREHPQSIIPLTWGIVHPVILLPMLARQWSTAMRQAVLLHELAHIQRGDILTQWIGRIACIVHWYHPLAWYALRQMRQEREQACDDAVVPAGARASDYADHLVKVARLCAAPRGLVLGMSEGNSLERRLHSLFDRSRSHAPVRRAVVVGLLILGTMLVGTIASITPMNSTVNAVESGRTPETSRHTNRSPVTTRHEWLVIGDAARDRLLRLKPQFGAARHGIQFAAAFSPGKIAFQNGERIPIELFLHNSGSVEAWLSLMVMYELFPPELTTVGGEPVPLSTSPHYYAIPTTVVHLKPGEVCVLQGHSIGIGSGQAAPALVQFAAGQFRLRYNISVKGLGSDGAEYWNEPLQAAPLNLEVVAHASEKPFVRTTGVPRAGMVSPERLELLKPRFGEAKRGIRLGVASITRRKAFATGELIPLTLLFHNASDRKLTFDTQLDFVADPPRVTNQRGETMQVSFILHWMFIGPTTISLDPGETWGIETTGLGIGAGGSVTRLQHPAIGKYKLIYDLGISEKLGQPVDTPIWTEHLTSGDFDFEITTNAQSARHLGQ